MGLRRDVRRLGGGLELHPPPPTAVREMFSFFEKYKLCDLSVVTAAHY